MYILSSSILNRTNNHSFLPCLCEPQIRDQALQLAQFEARSRSMSRPCDWNGYQPAMQGTGTSNNSHYGTGRDVFPAASGPRFSNCRECSAAQMRTEAVGHQLTQTQWMLLHVSEGEWSSSHVVFLCTGCLAVSSYHCYLNADLLEVVWAQDWIQDSLACSVIFGTLCCI